MAAAKPCTIDILHLCGGVGSRMGAGYNKILLPFGEGTILSFGLESWLRSALEVEAFLQSHDLHLRSLYLVGRNEELHEPLQQFLTSHPPLSASQNSNSSSLQSRFPAARSETSRVCASSQSSFYIQNRILSGGATRQESVHYALIQLADSPEPPDWVLIHDAARPGLLPDVLIRLFQALLPMLPCSERGLHAEWGLRPQTAPCAVCPVLPVSDTLRRLSPDGSRCIETLPREQCVRIQTPQLLPFRDLLRLHNQAKREGIHLSDDAELFLQNGQEPIAVIGDPALEKLTKPEDFSYLQLVLLHKSKE